jgi:hypothetical protein
MTNEQLEAARASYAGIETKTNEAVAKWAMEYVVPYLEDGNVQKTQMNGDGDSPDRWRGTGGSVDSPTSMQHDKSGYKP